MPNRPICPTTGELVKWFDNRYLTYISQSAKAKCPEFRKRIVAKYAENTGFTGGYWTNDPEVQTKTKATYAKTKATTGHKKVKRSATWHAKIKATWDLKLDKVAADSLREYKVKVKRVTEQSFRQYQKLLEVNGLKRGRLCHLDHIYSVYAGWKNKVDPDILGHITNLRLMNQYDNIVKSARCDKTFDALVDDYNEFKNTNTFNGAE